MHSPRSAFAFLISRLALLGLAATPIESTAQSSANAFKTTEHDLRGLPYFRFFEAKDFDSSASSTFVTTSADGTVFYGDRNWVFMYDGASWHTVYQNSNTTEKITIMKWADDGKIYAAGFESIGLAILNDQNELTFKSLVDPGTPLETGENFEKIKPIGSKVYFQGRRSFAIYDKETGDVDSHVFDTWLTASFLFDDAFHIVLDNNEVLRYDDGAFTSLEDISAPLKARAITFSDTITAPNGDIILGSERNGLFRFDGKSFEPAFPNFKHDPGHLLRDIDYTSDHRLVLAFLEGGILVIDDAGNVLEAFNAAVDHRFKSARNLTIDQSGTIWAIFNSTIAKILLDSPLTAIDERLRPSLFYATQYPHEGELYIRSFHILYKAVYDERDRLEGFINVLPNTEMEIWSVAPSEEGLYLSSGIHGIHLFSDGATRHLIDAPAFDRLNELASDPQYLVGANANEIILYRKTENGLEIADAIDNPASFINRMEEDRDGNLWLEYGLGAVGQVRVVDGKLAYRYFDSHNGLPKREWMTVWIHEGEALFTHSQGILQLDPETETFRSKSMLEDVFNDVDLRIERAFTDPKGNIWMSANDLNMILWKLDDGGYLKDDRSLREMGEAYFEFITFYEGGEAIITTAFELFHFKPRDDLFASPQQMAPTRIAAISSPTGRTKHFTYLGDFSIPQPRAFDHDENSLAFTVSNNASFSTKSPEFQYHLKGFSDEAIPDDDSPWTSSSTAYFTNLDHGKYVFLARSRLGSGQITPWVEYPFSIKPPFYHTLYAYSIYASLSLVVVLASIKLYSRRLRRQNLKLEQMVQERTSEIETQNVELEKQAEILESQNLELAHQSEEIQRNAAQLASALTQLRETQDQLLSTARTAGRAEVATNVLHNVGNVLNSVNVSLSKLNERLSQSRVDKLRKLASLVNQHRDRLEAFLAADERGRQVPAYLEQLAQVLTDEINAFMQEVGQMAENVDHIKKIISTQQSNARAASFHQQFDVGELLDTAIGIVFGEDPQAYQIIKQVDTGLCLESDKHSILEIMINLLKNAKEAVDERQDRGGRIEIAANVSSDGESIELRIVDDGVGIAPEHAKRLFTHGFTTKNQGHGFGLHSCANVAKSLGGSLALHSEGVNKGAVATLSIPIKSLKQASA